MGIRRHKNDDRKDKNEKKYKAALDGRNIPILTLDNKWHQLFTQTDRTPEIEALSNELNELLKRQGKVNSDIRKIRQLKKKLMRDIVSSMDMLGDLATDRKMDENKRLIEECNEKLEGYRDEYVTLPAEIDRLNYRLMLCTMDVCYRKLKENTERIKEIDEWIAKTRVELKEKLVKKQEDETTNQGLYSYMHDIFGAEVIEIFDMEYNPIEDESGQSGRKRDG